MSKAKHTEGPWSAFGPTGTGIHTQYLIRHNSPGRSGGSFATVQTLHSTDEAIEACAANARLIAAAPDLLEALKDSLQGLHAAVPHADRIRDILHPIIERTQDAIAKATEPQPEPAPSA